MVKNIITPSLGAPIQSGTPGADSIISVSVTETVNNSKDLTPGGAFPTMAEATIWSPDAEALSGKLSAFFDLDKQINEKRIRFPGGFYTTEISTTNKGTVKVVGYSPLRALEKDLTKWMESLDGWPYALEDFAHMVCFQCSLVYDASNIPNGNFPVYNPGKKATARQLIQWIGEICCRFLVDSPYDGIDLPHVKFDWFKDSGVTLTPSGETFYISGSQTNSLWDVPEVESVHVFYRTKEDDCLFPYISDQKDHHYYTLDNNPLIAALPTDDDGYILNEPTLAGYLNVIKQELSGLSYTPCKISCPADIDIRPGQIFRFIDKAGKTHKALCMKKITRGQKTTIECTGNKLRKQYHK